MGSRIDNGTPRWLQSMKKNRAEKAQGVDISGWGDLSDIAETDTATKGADISDWGIDIEKKKDLTESHNGLNGGGSGSVPSLIDFATDFRGSLTRRQSNTNNSGNTASGAIPENEISSKGKNTKGNELFDITGIKEFNKRFESVTGYKDFSLREPVKVGNNGSSFDLRDDFRKKRDADYELDKFNRYSNALAQYDKLAHDVNMGQVTIPSLLQSYNNPLIKKLTKDLVVNNSPQNSNLDDGNSVYEAVKSINDKNRINYVTSESNVISGTDTRISETINNIGDLIPKESPRTMTNMMGVVLPLSPGNNKITDIYSSLKSSGSNDSDVYDNNAALSDKFRLANQLIINIPGAKNIDKGQKEVLAQRLNSLMGELSYRMYYNTSKQKDFPKEVDAVSDAITRNVQTEFSKLSNKGGMWQFGGGAIIKTTSGQTVADVDRSLLDAGVVQFKMGLSYARDTNPSKYNQMIKNLSDGVNIAPTDFSYVMNNGQTIYNMKVHRDAAYNPDMMGKETDIKYTTLDQEVSRVMGLIGEMAQKDKEEDPINKIPVLGSLVSRYVSTQDFMDLSTKGKLDIHASDRYSPKQIDGYVSRLNAMGAGISDELKKTIKSDEATGLYGSIPRGGFVDNMYRGVLNVANPSWETIKGLFSSDTERYLSANKLYDLGGRLVPQSDGSYAGYLASQKDSVSREIAEGFGYTLGQIGLTIAGGIAAKGLTGVAFAGANMLRGAAAGAANSSELLGVAGSARLGAYLAKTGLAPKVAAKAFNIGGIAAMSYLQTYEGAYNNWLDKTGDKKKAILGAVLSSGIEFATETILSPLEMGAKMTKGLRDETVDGLLDIVTKAKGDISKISPDAYNSIRKRVGRSLLEAGYVTTAESAETVAGNILGQALESVLSPSTVNDANLAQENWDGIVQTSLQMLLPAFQSGLGEGIAGRITRGNLHYSAVHIEEQKEALNKAVQNGNMTQQEGNAIIALLETHRQSLNNAPNLYSDGGTMTDADQRDFAFEESRRKYFKDKIADQNVSDVEKENYQKQLNEATQIQRDILNKKAAAEKSDTDEELKKANPFASKKETGDEALKNANPFTQETKEKDPDVVFKFNDISEVGKEYTDRAVVGQDGKVTLTMPKSEADQLHKDIDDGKITDMDNIPYEVAEDAKKKSRVSVLPPPEGVGGKIITTTPESEREKKIDEKKKVSIILPQSNKFDGEIITPSPKSESLPTENTPKESDLLKQAVDNADDVKVGAWRDALKSGNEETVKQALNEISEQWHDPQSRDAAERAFGKKVVDVARTLFPKEEPKPLNIKDVSTEEGSPAGSEAKRGVSKNENTPERQETENPVQENTERIGQGESESATPVLKSKQDNTSNKNNLNIVEDDTENKHANGKLTEQDNPKQEPNVKAIESKAKNPGGVKTEKLEQAEKDASKLIDNAIDVKSIPVNDISTDEARFQGREKLDKKRVERIAKNWNDADQDPIHVWRDPKDGKLYVLSGHHRLAAAKHAGRDKVKTIDRTDDFTESQAVKFATEEANANRAMETSLERASTLRGKRERGDSKEDINEFLEREGKNKKYVENLSHLNPNGKVVQSLKQFSESGDRTTQKEAERTADWIGEARKNNKNLTDQHENELFDFLMNKDASKRVTTKADFLSKVSSITGGKYFDATKPLNIARYKYGTEGEKEYDRQVSEKKEQIAELQNQINDINDRFRNPNNPNYINTEASDYADVKQRADNQIADLNAKLKAKQKELQEIYQNKGKITNPGAAQGALFSKGNKDFKSITKEAFDALTARLNKAFGGVVKVYDNWNAFVDEVNKKGFSVDDSLKSFWRQFRGDTQAFLREARKFSDSEFYATIKHYETLIAGVKEDLRKVISGESKKEDMELFETISKAMDFTGRSKTESVYDRFAELRKDYDIDSLLDKLSKYQKEIEIEMKFKPGGSSVKLLSLNDTIYGAVLPDGTMYLNPEKINANTPIHEHTHLFNQIIQKTNPKLWNKIVEATKKTEVWDEVKNDPNYSNLKTDDQIADEVFSRIAGDRGEGSWQQKMAEADSKSAWGKVRDAVKEYWEAVKQFFGADIYKDMTAEDFADMTLDKLLSGKEVKGVKDAFNYNGDNNLTKRLREAGATDSLIDALGKDVKLREGFLTDTHRILESLLGLAGNYSIKDNTIRIGKFYSTLFGRNKVLIHEAVHAATMIRYQDILRNPDKYTAEEVKAVNEINDIAWEYYQNTSSLSKMLFPALYGTTNPFEFLAEFVANKKFRDYIGRTSENKKQNTLSYLWQRILNVLGFKGSMNNERLSEISKNIDTLLTKAGIDNEKNKGLTPMQMSTLGKSATDNVGTFSSESNDIRFQILGEKGAEALDKYDEATHRMDNLDVARQMEEAGKDKKAVRLATGWERGRDGKWRYEINDYLQAVSDVYELQGKHKGVVNEKASLFGSKELNKAYPELENVQVKITISDDAKNNGSYEDLFINGKKDSSQITVNATDVSKAQSILLHEMQHAIQHIEGFAKGGNEKMFGDKTVSKNKELISQIQDVASDLFNSLPDDVKTYARAINRGENTDENYNELSKNKEAKIIWANYINAQKQIKELQARPDDSVTKTAYQQYKRLAGEVEARNVQKRMDMTPEQRRETLLSETEDVAREDQTVIMDGLEQAMSVSKEGESNDIRFQIEGETDATVQKVLSAISKVMDEHFDKTGQNLSLEEVQERAAKAWNNNSDEAKQFVKQVYDEIGKRLKIAEDTGKPSWSDRLKKFFGKNKKSVIAGKIDNELTRGLMHKLTASFDKMFGEGKVSFQTVPNGDVIMEMAKANADAKFMYNKKGDVLGVTLTDKDGNPFIVLNAEKFNANTLLHEAAGHVMMDWFEQNNPELHKQGIAKVENSPYLNRVKKSEFYKAEAQKVYDETLNKTKDAKAASEAREMYFKKEALAQAIGDAGAQFLTATRRKTFQSWANKLWNEVGQFFGLDKLTPTQVSNLSLGEFSKMAAAHILNENATFDKIKTGDARTQEEGESEQQKQTQQQDEPKSEFIPNKRVPKKGNFANGGVLETLAGERLFRGNIPQSIKDALGKYDLSYKQRSQTESANTARAIINDIGLTNAYDLAMAGYIRGAIKTQIQADMLESLSDAVSEADATTDAKLIEAASDEMARIAIAISEDAHDAGDASSMWNRIYKTSSVGYNADVRIQDYKKNHNGEIPEELAKKFRELEKTIEEQNEIIEKLRPKAEEEAGNDAVDSMANRKNKADKKRRKELANRIRKLKTKPITLTDENGNPIEIKTNAFVDYNSVVELIAKAVEKTGDIIQAISDVLENQKWYQSLTDTGKKNVRSQLENQLAGDAFISDDLDITQQAIYDMVDKGRATNANYNIHDLIADIKKEYGKQYPDRTDADWLKSITDFQKERESTPDDTRVRLAMLRKDAKLLQEYQKILNEGNLPGNLQLSPLLIKNSDERRYIERLLKHIERNTPQTAEQLARARSKAVAAIRTRMENQIADMEIAMKDGKPIVERNKTELTDPKDIALKERYETVKKQYHDLFKSDISDQQKLARREDQLKKALDKLLEKYDNLKQGKEESKTEEPLPVSDRTKELEAQIKQVQDDIKEFKKSSGIAERERVKRSLDSIDRAIARYGERMNNNDFAPTKKAKFFGAKDNNGNVSYNDQLIQAMGKRNRKLREFDKAAYEAERENRTTKRKIFESIAEWLSVPKALKATLDISALFRQGGMLFVSDNKQWREAAGMMFKMMRSKDFYDDRLSDIEMSTYGIIAAESGLDITNLDIPTMREERFLNSEAFRKLNVATRAHQASERAYSGFLNELRMAMFIKGARLLEMNHQTIETDPDAYKRLATFLNNVTGRGRTTTSPNMNKALNTTFFSPKMITSRVLLAGDLASHDPIVRSMAWKSVAGFASWNIAVLAMVNLMGAAFGGGDDDDKKKGLLGRWGKYMFNSLNPINSDFLKGRYKNLTVDASAGYAPLLRTALRMGFGLRRSISGKVTDLDNTFGQSRLSEGGSFFANKLSPTMNVPYSFLTNQNINFEKRFEKGESKFSDATIGDILGSLIPPIVLQNAWDLGVSMYDKFNGKESDLDVQIPNTLLDIVGISTTVQQDNTSPKDEAPKPSWLKWLDVKPLGGSPRPKAKRPTPMQRMKPMERIKQSNK